MQQLSIPLLAPRGGKARVIDPMTGRWLSGYCGLVESERHPGDFYRVRTEGFCVRSYLLNARSTKMAQREAAHPRMTRLLIELKGYNLPEALCVIGSSDVDWCREEMREAYQERRKANLFRAQHRYARVA